MRVGRTIADNAAQSKRQANELILIRKLGGSTSGLEELEHVQNRWTTSRCNP